MSTCIFDNFTGPNNTPAYFPNGVRFGSAGGGAINNIGTPNTAGFGVGICPGPLPSGMTQLPGFNDPWSDNYGNYIHDSSGSVMYWRPAHWRKWGTGANGLALNRVDIKPFGYFASVAEANAAGYYLPRSFYDGGAIQPGYFRDKYKCSNNNGVASSIKGGKPLSSAADHNPFSALSGAPSNNYGGAIAAAKTRGANFFCATRFMKIDSAMIALAQAQNATSAAFCAWYDAAGVASYPKGCNNSALGDTNDSAILYLSDGYSNCGKTGSANLFARTTDNGQNCGSADENGLMWEVNPGLSSDGVNLYILKASARMRDLTGGNTLTTDLWGSTGLSTLYDSLGTTYQSLTDSDSVKYFGSAAQVFSAATSGIDWAAAGAGIPLAGGVSGTNAFGNDGLWDYAPSGRNELCLISGGAWGDGSGAGVWALHLGSVRGGSSSSVGFRAALYL